MLIKFKYGRNLKYLRIKKLKCLKYKLKRNSSSIDYSWLYIPTDTDYTLSLLT